jgi:hypothetical protein
MCIVQPGSATVNTNGVMLSPATTRASRSSPATGSVTTTGTSMLPSPGSALARPVRPSPSMRTLPVPPV